MIAHMRSRLRCVADYCRSDRLQKTVVEILKTLVVCSGSACDKFGGCRSLVVNNAIYLALATLWFLTLAVPARALDPDQPASSYIRTHFTTDDGLPGTVVGQM